MGEKIDKAVKAVKDVAGSAGAALVEAGKTIAEGLASTAADDTDLAREAAEGFADRAGAQRDRATAADNKGDYARAVEGRVPNISHLPEDQPLELRFGDGESFFGDAVPVERSRFKPDGFGTAYLDPLTFDASGDLHRLTEAWLLGGAGAVKCEIGGGVFVGGGHEVQLPGGHLIF